MRFNEASQESLWHQIRKRILLETSAFLSVALRRPEMGVSIPMVVVGRGGFSKAFAEEFWRQVLAD